MLQPEATQGSTANASMSTTASWAILVHIMEGNTAGSRLRCNAKYRIDVGRPSLQCGAEYRAHPAVYGALAKLEELLTWYVAAYRLAGIAGLYSNLVVLLASSS